MDNKNHVALLAALLLGGCATIGPTLSGLSDARLETEASAGPLTVEKAFVITDNDAAFQSKLRLVNEAKTSIDLAYYIYGDDYSSSVLSEALIAAAQRGVKVRLLVDYFTNYPRLDLFSMLERRGTQGPGKIEVRFYGRPTRNIVQNAVYMTMGCGQQQVAGTAAKPDCSKQKFARVDDLFAKETIDGIAAAERNISNVNSGASGLFLSGLYSKRPDIMAMAMQQAQAIDPAALQAGATGASAQDKENLKKLARLHWQSRTGSAFQRLEANTQLFFVSALYGEQLAPVQSVFASALPIDRKLSDDELRDWDHLTDFTHHKLLLTDGTRMQMGGRNVADSYHMHPNPLVEKYVFMDTDLVATVPSGAERLTSSYENLWSFSPMVATLAEVRAHAPNDFAANVDAYAEAEKPCAGVAQGRARESCMDQGFQRRAKSLEERIAQRAVDMEQRARRYRTQYAPSIQAPATRAFPVDATAQIYYLENLTFDKGKPAASRKRLYGAQAGRESAGGKHIHVAWQADVRGICARATKDAPQQVILHNAYFYPAGNLAAALSELFNGKADCSNVTVKVVTNSIETTDLNVVNLLARHSIKAFAEFYMSRSDRARRAKFEYYEYQSQPGATTLSLHSKVSVIGEDLVVGSANADVRSFMMDSNNAALLRSAPALRRDYMDFLQRIMDGGGRVKQLNDYFANTPREKMIAEDLVTFRQLLAKYRVEQRLDPVTLKAAESRFVELLNLSYSLTRDAINPDATEEARRAAQNKFNELFKPI
jgi:cardiolipin synthase C